MSNPAPVCNVTVYAPPADPTSPGGFRTIQPRATLEQVIQIVNDNFSPRVQAAEFDRQLARDINQGQGTKKGGLPRPSQVQRAAQREVAKLSFKQRSIVRKKMKVTNPKNKRMWVIDDRVVALIMRDARTGAEWVFEDKQAAKGESAGSEETQDSG